MPMTYATQEPSNHTNPPPPPVNPEEKPYSVIREFGPMVLFFVGVFLGIYLLLGLVVNVVAPHIPVGLEKSLGHLVEAQFSTQGMPTQSARLQTIIDRFTPALTPDDRRLTYRVKVIPEDTVNAVALPGGMVVVFSGLLNKIESTEEIAFVLAHELGHFHYRHHLKGVGRSLLTMLISITILGEDSAITQLIVSSFHQLEMKFSRGQEKEADLYALDLLKKCYGSVNGALKFMEKQAREEKTWHVLYYFASHPHPQERLEYMRKAVKEKEDHRLHRFK